MIMKKWIAMVITAVLLAAMALPGIAAAEDVTLQFWHIHTNETRKVPIENAVARFEEANPGVKVEITVLENDPYKTKLRTVMGSGDAPDVFHSWGGGWLKAFSRGRCCCWRI